MKKLLASLVIMSSATVAVAGQSYVCSNGTVPPVSLTIENAQTVALKTAYASGSLTFKKFVTPYAPFVVSYGQFSGNMVGTEAKIVFATTILVEKSLLTAFAKPGIGFLGNIIVKGPTGGQTFSCK